MCKLNIQCSEMEGQCSCDSMSSAWPSSPCTSMLTSILSQIKTQEEIMRGLIEDAGGVYEVPEDSTIASTSPVHDSPVSELDYCSIDLVSELIQTVCIGRPFSMMFQISSNNRETTLDEPVNVYLMLEDYFTGQIKVILGQVESKGTILFKSITINQFESHARLIVRSDHDNIQPYYQDVRVLHKPSKIKKSKSAEYCIDRL